MKAIVVGGGASGLVSAINLKKKGYEVLILERNDKCGKKILVSGNSHCNYYNEDQDLSHYHSSNPELVSNLINEKTNNKVLDFFNNLGIIPRIKNGYYYPYSNTSISIQNTLVLECIKLGISIKYNSYVVDIKNENSSFIIKCDNNEKYTSDILVMSTGSNASVKEDVNTYSLLKKMGHTVNKIYPALSRINLNEKYMKDWSGVRNNVSLKILVNNEEVKSDNGEILYTDNGISGIVTMQLSNIASVNLDKDKEVEVVINNLYELCSSRNEFIKLMDDRNNLLLNRNISELLDGLINYKLVIVLIKRVGLNPQDMWNKLTDREKNILASSFVDLRLKVIETDSILKAQTKSGGVVLSEVDLNTMESKIVKNLYLTGETLDIFGDCGGYNLTIAWTTGLLVGGLND